MIINERKVVEFYAEMELCIGALNLRFCIITQGWQGAKKEWR